MNNEVSEEAEKPFKNECYFRWSMLFMGVGLFIFAGVLFGEGKTIEPLLAVLGSVMVLLLEDIRVAIYKTRSTVTVNVVDSPKEK